MENLLYFLACWGATQIIVYSKIFVPIRKLFTSLLTCGMCTSFHVGWIFYLTFMFCGVPLIVFTYTAVGAFLYACASSAICYLLTSIVDDDGLKFTKKIKVVKE